MARRGADDDDLEIVEPYPGPDELRGWAEPDDQPPTSASKKSTSPRRIVAAAVAAAVGLAALGVVAVARGTESDDTSPEATIDLGSTAGPGTTAADTAGESIPAFGSTVLVTGDEGARLVDLDVGTFEPITGLPSGPVRRVNDWGGAAVLSDRTGALYLLEAGTTAATPLDSPEAFAGGPDFVWLIDDEGIRTSARPEQDPTPIPEGATPIAGLAGQLVLRDADDDLISFDPASGSQALLAEANDPVVLATGTSRMVWTDGSCAADECTVLVTDAETRVTASIEARRPVAHAALTTGGSRVTLFDGAGWFAEVTIASGEVWQWRSLGESDTVDAAYRPGDSRLLVLVSAPPRVISVSSDRAEWSDRALPAAAADITWVAPSSSGGPSWNVRRTAAPPIEGRRPPLLLGEQSGVEVAFVDDLDRAQAVDLDTGESRFLYPLSQDLRETGSSAYATAAVGGGILVSFENGSWWYPPDGVPVPLEREWTLQDETSGTALAVEYGAGSEPLQLRLFEPAAGAFLDAGEPVHLFPVALAGRSVLFEQPPGLHERSPGLISLDLDTNEERLIPSPEPGAYVLAAGAGHIVWQSDSEVCAQADCPVVVTDALGVVQQVVASGLARLAALSPDGTSLALAPAGSDSAPLVVDLVSGSVRELAPVGAVFGLDWSASGWLLLSSGVAITGETTLWALPPGGNELIGVPGLRIAGAFTAG